MSVPTRAVLFDLDGTLYHQGPLRAAMAWELARASLLRGPGAARRLSAFRSAREELRERGRPDEPLERLQYELPAGRLGVAPEALEATVREWMFERPLPHVARHARADLGDALWRLERAGLRLGVFSDYPARTKLEALGVAERFELQLCATDPEVNAFKPHAAGFLHACERLGLEPAEVAYVGDRADVDGAGARAAGLRSLVIGPARDDGLEWILRLEEVADVVHR